MFILYFVRITEKGVMFIGGRVVLNKLEEIVLQKNDNNKSVLKLYCAIL